jgi:hypothetical protein
MIKWTDQHVDPSGFGSESVSLLRDIPHLGIVLSVSKRDTKPLRLSTWDRETKLRIRERHGSRGADQHDRSAWTFWGTMPALGPSGELIYFSDQPLGERPGKLNRLTHDGLEGECLISGLPPRNHIETILVSPDAKLAYIHCDASDDWISGLYCLETRSELRRSRAPPEDRWSRSFQFSPCSKMAISSSESIVQSGSEQLHFSLLDVRNGMVILSGDSSVYSESLYISADGSSVLLRDGLRGYIKSTWPIPEDWQQPESALPPPEVGSWARLNPRALVDRSREDPARFLGAALAFFERFPCHPQAEELWRFLQSEPSLLAKTHPVWPSVRGNETAHVLPLVVSRLNAEGKRGSGKAPLLKAMDHAMSNPEIRPSWNEFNALLKLAPEWLVLYALDFAEQGLWRVDSILGSFKLQTNRALLVVAGVALAKSEMQEIRWAVRDWLHPVLLAEHVYAAIEQALPADDPPRPKTEWE